MTLEITQKSAESGLAIQQQSLYISSQNIARSKEEGFIRLKINNKSDINREARTGRIFDEWDSYLESESRKQITVSSYTETKNEHLQNIVNLFGSPNTSFDEVPDDTSYNIPETLGKFFASINLLSSEPENEAQKQDIVLKATELSYLISHNIKKLDEISLQIENDIKISTQDLNHELEQIYKINERMTSTPEGTEERANLNMIRNLAVENVASQININVFHERSNGVHIITPSGITVVDKIPREFSYEKDKDGNIKVLMNTKEPQSISQVIFDERNNNTKLLENGRIKALLEIKNKYVPQTRKRLVDFAESLTQSVNDVMNGATAYPGDKILASKEGDFVAGAKINFDGNIRIAPILANSKVLKDNASHEIKALDIDMSKFKTLEELQNEINSFYTTPNKRAEIENKIANISLYVRPNDDQVTLGFDIDSALDLKQDINIDKVKVTYIDKLDSKEKTLTHSTESKKYSLDKNERKTLALLDDTIDRTKIPADSLKIKVNFRVDNINHEIEFNLDTKSLTKISRIDANSISGSKALIQKENPQQYLKAMISKKKGNVLDKSNSGFFQLTSLVDGVNVVANRVGEISKNDFLKKAGFHDFFTKTFNAFGEFEKLEVNKSYIEKPNNIPTTYLADSPIPSIGPGGNSLLIKLSTLTEQKIIFGNKPELDETLVSYISQTIEYVASDTRDARDTNEREKHLKEIIEKQKSTLTGVNIEEEIQNIMEVKYMYNASAHVLAALKEIYAILMDNL